MPEISELAGPFRRRPLPERPLISVVVPAYNEQPTIIHLLEQLAGVDCRKEVIVVDDGSTDGTRELLEEAARDGRLLDRLIVHPENRGKGAALRTGFATAAGDIVIVQDADLEYDPRQFPTLLEPILSGKADVVYGSRFLSGTPHRVLFFWHSVANRILTLLSNMLTDLNLTDMLTCYKVFRSEVIHHLKLRENRFGFESEVTAKMAKLRCRVYEVGISYHGRTYAEGKKIGFKDAIRTFLCVFRYALFQRPEPLDWMAGESARSADGASSQRSETGAES